MISENYNRPLHWMAWVTLIVALLPISVGALVTTVDAGMAFADWPTSHGQGMLAFPWWQSRGDEFLEHGHRLAGMLIGLVTLGLAGVAFLSERGAEVRGLVAAILLGVILQGLLGGVRVLADERLIAMLHALFAAVVFSLMGLLVMLTSRRGSDPATWQPAFPDGSVARRAWTSGICLILLTSVQYVLGGLLRHLGLAEAWLIHPWFALAVLGAALTYRWQLRQTDSRVLRGYGTWVVGLLVAQAALGLVTWGVRYGFPAWNLMAIQNTTVQVAVRSLHKVLGILAFMTTIVAVVRLWFLLPVVPTAIADGSSSSRRSPDLQLPAAGGAV